MVTRDVLKVLKLHSSTACAILRTFKTSLVPINHEMHSRSYGFLFVLNCVVLPCTLMYCLVLHRIALHRFVSYRLGLHRL